VSKTEKEPRTNRREMLARAAAVAAGAAAATLVGAAPAQAADGDSLTLGDGASNASSTKTLWTGSGTIWMLELNGSEGIRSTMSGVSAGTAFQGETNASGIGAIVANNDSASGYGVFGQADGADAVGVWARSEAGTALHVQGAATFDRSGVATIGAAKRSVTISVPVSAGTMAFATLQQVRTGVWVEAAVPRPKSDTVTITLNKAVTKKTKVAWFVLG
jgi:hypothetical protein